MSLDKYINPRDNNISDWYWIKAKEFMEFNPRESVKKGTLVKNVPMDKIEPNTKEISNFDETEFKGGVKFRNGDTLMARITPCLENGKISQVNILEEGEIGCGSTEFIVLREKDGISDKDFIYYLSKSDTFKEPAIKSMVGSSGRQRVQRDVVENLDLFVPPLKIQKKIGELLSSFDKKITLNKQINHNLANFIDTNFKYQLLNFENFSEKDFINSEFGLIPKGWKVSNLTEIATYQNGLPMQKFPPENLEDSYKVLKIKELRQGFCDDSSDICTKNIKEECIVNDGDVIFSWSGSLLVDIWSGGTCGLNQHLFKVTSEDFNKWFYYCWTKFYLDQFILIAKDKATTMGHIKREHLKESLVLIPDKKTYSNLTKLFEPLFDLLIKNKIEIKKLQNLRDTLLPKLMSGEIDVSKVNCDLKLLIKKFIIKIIKYYGDFNMKTKLISKIQNQMKPFLNQSQYLKLTNSLLTSLKDIEIIDNNNESNEKDNFKLLKSFLSAKQVEGRSEKTLIYYYSTLEKMLSKISKQVYNITTDDIRRYLFDYKKEKNSSKITIDNMRRIFSSFFSWLEDEDYILKNPVRRIHRVKTGRVVKEVLTDENLEILRDNCHEIRDLAIVEILISTGIRVGELVRLNIRDINFYERECVVFGKGESERVVYFDARTKIHLLEYLESRTDDNPALFVSLNKPNERLGISGVETRLRELGRKCKIPKVHPHKFRRTLATNAIDKGMPIEQVQKLLGHVQIDTTMQYAMVNQSNVKIAHRKFIS